MVDAGVRATMSADDSSEAIDQIIEDIERARADGDRVIRTAQGALRLLERDRRQ
jgi:hypothetical protein